MVISKIRSIYAHDTVALKDVGIDVCYDPVDETSMITLPDNLYIHNVILPFIHRNNGKIGKCIHYKHIFIVTWKSKRGSNIVTVLNVHQEHYPEVNVW